MLETVRGGAALSVRYSLRGEGWMNKGGFTQIELQEPLLFHDPEAANDALSRVDEGASLKHAGEHIVHFRSRVFVIDSLLCL